MEGTERTESRKINKAPPFRSIPSRHVLSVLSLLSVLSFPSATAANPAPKVPKDIQYVRGSIEFSAVDTEIYRDAWRAVRALAKKQKGPWAVVLDCDQTVLDNSAFQARLGPRPFSMALWDQWVRLADAAPVPGAKDFLDRTRALPGAHIVFITDRTQGETAATRRNLVKDGLYKSGDLLLDKDGRKDTKDVRRACVEKALDPRCRARGPMPIIALFGDSARDFVEFHGRAMETAGRAEILKNAGATFFVLVNPMYGQWQNGYK